MKARMRRLSVSVDSPSVSDHDGDGKSTDGLSGIDRVKKLLSSPLTRRKSACNPTTIGSSSSSPRIFGTSLAVLAHQPSPITTATLTAVPSSSSTSSTATTCTNVTHTSSKQPYIPFVMTRLCDFIECNSGLTQEGLFRVSGNAKLVDRLRNIFDATGDAPLESDGDVPSAAALLKLFLRELPDPVIPQHCHPQFLEAAKDFNENKESCLFHLKNLVNGLPDENYYTLKYLSHYLNRVSQRESQNRMNSSSLGIVFGPNLFRVASTDFGLKEQTLTNQVVSAFISDYNYIFEETCLGNRISRSLLTDAIQATSPSASSVSEPIDVEIPVPKTSKTKVSEPIDVEIPVPKTSKTKVSEKKGQKCIIPLLTVNNEEIPSSKSSSGSKGVSLSFLKGKKRKDRRLSAIDNQSGQLRSSSEERPSPELALDIRRCNSSEEMSCDRGEKSFTSLSEENLLLDVRPHPSFPIPKRRHHVDDDDEHIDKEHVAKPSPTLSDSSCESNEARRTDERMSTHIRPPPINRTMRMKAMKSHSADVQQLRCSSESIEFERASVDTSRTSSRELSRPIDSSDNGDSNDEQAADEEEDDKIESTEDTKLSSDENLLDCSAEDVDKVSQIQVQEEEEEQQEQEHATETALAIDVDTLRLNVLSCGDPTVAHRFSWPYLTKEEDVEDTSTANTATYPLLHSSIHNLKNKKPSKEAPISPSARLSSDDCTSRSPSAFRTFLHQRPSLLDPAIPPSPPIDQETYPDKRSMNEAPAVKEIKKRIHSLKRHLKEFEADFERNYGYKPSQDQKLNSFIAKPIITELTRLRVQLKELREDESFLEIDLSTARVQSSFHEKIDRDFTEASDEIENALRISRTSSHSRLDEALHKMQETLEIKRSLVDRPALLETMTADQIMDEKLDLQKALLKFESIYGRPDNRQDRDIMRPLYERYRAVKRLLAKMPNKPAKKDSSDLQPILENVIMENVAMSFNSPMQSRSDISLQSIDYDETKEKPQKVASSEIASGDSSKPSLPKFSQNLHELPFKELLKQLQETRAEKRHLRQVIKRFEDEFYSKMGRKVERADRVHLETVYNNYKVTKGKLRLLEALVAKSQQNQHYI